MTIEEYENLLIDIKIDTKLDNKPLYYTEATESQHCMVPREYFSYYVTNNYHPANSIYYIVSGLVSGI